MVLSPDVKIAVALAIVEEGKDSFILVYGLILTPLPQPLFFSDFWVDINPSPPAPLFLRLLG